MMKYHYKRLYTELATAIVYGISEGELDISDFDHTELVKSAVEGNRCSRENSRLSKLLEDGVNIVNHAIMHGMPITPDVARFRNRALGYEE